MEELKGTTDGSRLRWDLRRRERFTATLYEKRKHTEERLERNRKSLLHSCDTASERKTVWTGSWEGALVPVSFVDQKEGKLERYWKMLCRKR